MVQSDTLSRPPDYGTNKQMEEEDKVILPDNLFINLLDTELQEQILNRKKFDLDVKNTIKTLMKEGPTSLKNDLQDWKIKEIDGRKTIFFKELYTKRFETSTRHCEDVPQSQNSRTPRGAGNLQWN
jgi:hypothetical protein